MSIVEHNLEEVTLIQTDTSMEYPDLDMFWTQWGPKQQSMITVHESVKTCQLFSLSPISFKLMTTEHNCDVSHMVDNYLHNITFI